MFFIIRFLIILPVENIMFQDIVFRKPMPLLCRRSQHRVTFLYLSSIPLGVFVTMIGSTCLTLWWTYFTCKCGTMGPYISSAILTSSGIIGRFYRMLLSTACSIGFTFWTVVWFNCLVKSSLFTSRAVYCFLFSSTCGMGENESFTMLCAFFFFLRRYIISW